MMIGKTETNSTTLFICDSQSEATAGKIFWRSFARIIYKQSHLVINFLVMK
jgi:hypothetical protein